MLHLPPLTLAILLASGCFAEYWSDSVENAVRVEDSGVDEVIKFSTSIQFYIDLRNIAQIPYEVKITPLECCLEIESHDLDCEVMVLRPNSISLHLESHNGFGSASFHFRNLYARYRRGNCSFLISTEGPVSMEWKHSLSFDTYPKNGDIIKCHGIDQDPDRACSPVDCAIKYKGLRNFYRNTTGKCEPVVPCNTRGATGGIIAYYDTDLNLCHSLELNSSENAVYQIESDPDIPAVHSLHPLTHSTIQDVIVEEYDNTQALSLTPVMDCNHGVQMGSSCVCDEGWASSGLDSGDKKYYWCDVRDSTGMSFDTGPVVLSPLHEMLLVMVSSEGLTMLNILLVAGWIVLVYVLFNSRFDQQKK